MGSTAHTTRVPRFRRRITAANTAAAVVAVAAATLGVAACAGADDDAASEAAADATAAPASEAPAELLSAGGTDRSEADAPAAPTPDSAERAGGGGGVGGVGALLAPADAQLAIEARARVQVDDVRAAVDGVRVAVDRAGGRVASASIAYPDGGGSDDNEVGDDGSVDGAGGGGPDERATATLTLLVPPDQLGAIVERLEELGELTSFDQFAEDVGDQLTDLDTRIANARASVDRARELLQEATSLQDLVFLEDELTRRETDLELLLAAQAELEGRVALSTLTVEITEAATPADEAASGRGVVDALATGWDAFVTAVLTVAVGLAAAAPFLVALALAVAAFLGVRRWRRTPPAAATSSAGPAGSGRSGDVSAEPDREPDREPLPAGSAEPGSRPG
jgi:hypothetical protein